MLRLSIRPRDALRRQLPPCMWGLPEAALERVRTLTVRRTFHRGEVIFAQGRHANSVLFVRTGLLQVYRLTETGRIQAVELLCPGACFCLAPHFQTRRSPLWVRALRVSEVSILDAAPSAALMDEPSFEMRTRECLATRLDEAYERIEELATQDVAARIVGTLARLGNECGLSDGEKGVLLPGLTHDGLASLVGAAREVVSRHLTALRTQGLLARVGGTLHIPDLARLAQQAAIPAEHPDEKTE